MRIKEICTHCHKEIKESCSHEGYMDAVCCKVCRRISCLKCLHADVCPVCRKQKENEDSLDMGEGHL